MQNFDLKTSRRLMLVLFAAQSLFSAASIAAFTLMAVVATDLSGNESLAGVPSTILTFSRALFAFPLGVLMDRFGRRNGLTFAYFWGVIAGALGAFAIGEGSFMLLVLAAAILGLARGGADQSRFTAAEVYPEDKRARVIGLIVFAGTVGAVGGPAIVDPAGRLVEGMGLNAYAGAWVATGFLTLLATLSIYFFLRPDPSVIARQMGIQQPPIAVQGEGADDPLASTLDEVAIHGIGSKGTAKRSLGKIFRDPQVQLAVASMLVAQTVMQMLMVITSLHMKHHDHSSGDISIVIMAHTLGMFGLASVSGWLIDHFGRINMILLGAVILISSFLIAPLSTSTLLLVMALFLLGLGWNFCFVGGSSLLSDALTPEERGQAQGLNEALVAVAAGFGSLSAGPVFKYGDYIAVAAACLILTLVLTGMIGRFSGRRVQVAEQAV